MSIRTLLLSSFYSCKTLKAQLPSEAYKINMKSVEKTKIIRDFDLISLFDEEVCDPEDRSFAPVDGKKMVC